MAGGKDHESRITALEQQLEAEARARASQDDELHETGTLVRSTRELMKALRETQSDHDRKLHRITENQLPDIGTTQLRHAAALSDLKAEVSDVKHVQAAHTVVLQRILARLESHDDQFKLVHQQFARAGARFDRVLARLEGHDQRFDRVDRRFEQMDERIQRMDERIQRMDDRFERMDQRFQHMDQRFRAMDQRFRRMDQRFERMDQRFERVDQRFQTMDERFDRVMTALESQSEQLARHSEQLDRLVARE